MSKTADPKNNVQLEKHDLYFAEEPAGQIERALALLTGLENLHVEKGTVSNSLLVTYNLRDYSLERLETALKMAGFCFKENLLDKLNKKLICYCEEVQYHNLNTPAHLTKGNAPELFAKLYDKHPHGDHDDTPKELRENP